MRLKNLKKQQKGWFKAPLYNKMKGKAWHISVFLDGHITDF